MTTPNRPSGQALGAPAPHPGVAHRPAPASRPAAPVPAARAHQLARPAPAGLPVPPEQPTRPIGPSRPPHAVPLATMAVRSARRAAEGLVRRARRPHRGDTAPRSWASRYATPCAGLAHVTSGAHEVREDWHWGTGPVSQAATTETAADLVSTRAGVRLARLDGTHSSGVAASLPIGVF